MAERVEEIYRGYRIVKEPSPVCNGNSVWVDTYKNRVGKTVDYLLLDGTDANTAGDGWFDSVAHAKKVIDRISPLIILGGE